MIVVLDLMPDRKKIHIVTLELSEPAPNFLSRKPDVDSVFKEEELHTVSKNDANTVVEPVSFGNYYTKGVDGHDRDPNQWLLRVKNGLWPEFGNARDLIAPFLKAGTVVIPVPSSKVNKINGMAKLTKALSERGHFDGTAVLTRVTEVPQQHKTTATRSRDLHLDSIEVMLPDEVVGRRILLLDDIFTSGTTMSACLELLHDAGATDVTCACLGRTL